MKHHHLIAGLLAALWLGALGGGAVQAQVTDAQVQAKIDELVQEIYDQRNEHGIWDELERGSGHREGTNWGGATALMTFALLTAGESYQDPRLKPAIEFLREAELRGTYAIAFRAHVWAALPDRFRQYLRYDVEWLIRALGPHGYDYTDTPRPNRVDNSVTQYGVLGVWEGAKRGLPVSQNYWERIQEHFIEYQHADGGWSYSRSGNPRGSMVAAGVAGLYITQDYLHRADFRELGQTPEHPVQQRIDKGLDWFAENFRPDTNPGHSSYTEYYLYGVERIGLASGVKYFAGHDWYASGAEYLLQNPGRNTDMAFSLMFLVRGRVPVFANKLQIPDAHWNNRPRDIAHLTAWASDESERQMIWQVVPLHTEPETWLEAPMLYLSGHEPLDLSEDEEARIKRYIDLGGMLVTTADDDSTAFTRSVEDLLERLYPDYPLEPIDREDELYNLTYRIGTNRLNAESVHNGVRHLAIHIPRDVSWTFHSNDRSEAAAWQLLTNAYFYATERGRSRARLDAHFLRRTGGEGGRDTVSVGRAVYDGNHDPEPLAWEVQSNFLHNEGMARVATEAVPLDDLPDPGEVPFVHVAGTEAHAFTSSELESIRRYVDAGGMMLFENVGGSGDFANAADTALSDLFERRLRPISTESPLVHGIGIGGFDVSRVAYRPYTVLRMGQVNSPRLLALTFDDQVRVIVSAEDLSNGMLDQPVWGLLGYDSESAQQIMANLVLGAAAQQREAASETAAQ